MTSETSAVRASSFHTHPGDRPEARQPVVQFNEAGGRGRERLDTQHAAVHVDRSRDMHIEVRIHSAGHRARVSTMVIAIPSVSNG